MKHFVKSLSVLSILLALACDILLPDSAQHPAAEHPYFTWALLIGLAVYVIALLISLGNTKVRDKLSYSALFYAGAVLVLNILNLLTAKFAILPVLYFPSLDRVFGVLVEDSAFLATCLAYSARLPDAVDALSAIHRPKTKDDMAQARRRMVFEELFLLCCGLQQLKERRKADSGIVFTSNGLDSFFEALCALAAQNGWQAAFMAPTEILAAQHAETLAPMLDKLGISCTLLTGSMTAAQKRAALAAIETGAAQVVVGTHALIQQGVQFHRLGAVIADEQHRFGVAQRAALSAKGGSPHVLVMSATPIPRTLALIMYGDLDVSVLDEIPPGRSPVETYAVGENMRKRITAFIDKQVGLGGQAYVVCPLIEDSENAETKLKSAEQHAKDLQKLLPHRRVAVLHGRMKNAEKDQIMRDFAAQKYDILVATTVIEVGVDVPNANLMVVEDADRFGLSQLHQLRGRVGRGTRQSYCVFFGADKGQVARERLRILCRTGDGFEVARADLAQRGPGDFFGQRQHGLPALHVADLAADLALMQNAREEAEALLSADPTLAGYPILLDRVQRMFAEQNDEAFN